MKSDTSVTSDAHSRLLLRFLPAGLFLALQIAILAALLPHEWSRTLLFWYCNNIAFFIAIAFFQGNIQMVKGLSYVGILAQLLWVADFTSHLLGFDFSGIANYVFVQGLTFANGVSIVIHFAIPILALLWTAGIRPRPISLFYSAIYVSGLYVATIAGTTPVDDINCVFNACTQYTSSYQIFLWPFCMTILAIGGYALHEGIYRAYTPLRRKTAWMRVEDIGMSLIRKIPLLA